MAVRGRNMIIVEGYKNISNCSVINHTIYYYTLRSISYAKYRTTQTNKNLVYNTVYKYSQD